MTAWRYFSYSTTGCVNEIVRHESFSGRKTSNICSHLLSTFTLLDYTQCLLATKSIARIEHSL